MAEAEIDATTFYERLLHLHDSWESSTNNADCHLVVWGNAEVPFSQNVSVSLWLIGLELLNTAILFTPSEVHILSGPKKAAILRSALLGDDIPMPMNYPESLKLFIHDINKADSDQGNLTLLHSVVSQTGNKVGIIQGEKHLLTTPFSSRVLSSFSSEFSLVDSSLYWSFQMASKDEREQKNATKAAKVASAIASQFLVPKIEEILDRDKKTKHKTLSKNTSAVIIDPSPLKLKINANYLEQSRVPLIQSGSAIDPHSLESDGSVLTPDLIVFEIGTRYRSYCAAVGRTIFINPNGEQKKMYQCLEKFQNVVVENLKSDEPISDLVTRIHESGSKLLSDFDLTDCSFSDCIGHVTGLLFEESEFRLCSDCNQTLPENSTIILKLVIQNSNGDVFWITDTCLVTSDKTLFLTEKSSAKFKEICYQLDLSATKEKEIPTNVHAGASHRPSTRSQQESAEIEQQREERQARQAHQQELGMDLIEKNLRKYKGGVSVADDQAQVIRVINLYRSHSEMPRQALGNRIVVDPVRESVLFPIRGQCYPIHIATIKSISKSDEGPDHFLRINLNAPGTSTLAPFSQDIGDVPYVKLLCYGSRSGSHINEVFRSIKELQKRSRSKEKQIQEEASLIEQEKLVLARGRPIVLRDVIMRPNISGRKTTGILEIHTNGIRFHSSKRETIDILFTEKDLLVILHFHLKHDIMIGKKKHLDVQFIKEVVPESTALDSTTMGRGRREHDELMEEEREKRRKLELNSEFFNFAKKVEEVSDLDFDIPYRELAFDGVPSRSTVTLIPSVHCLLSISESPFFVLCLDDVEAVLFERVSFSYGSFDIVFLFKDYTRNPSPIKAIASKQLEDIKDWLNSVDIKFFETSSMYNWEKLIEQIRTDPLAFWHDDGWAGLAQNEANDETDESLDEGDEAFDIEEDDLEPDVQDEGLSLSSEFEDEEEDEEESEGEEEEEEGLTWEELEERAAREDEMRLTEGVPLQKKKRR
ncbi:hypothetical protein GEMRC1_010942 [Eukaryota sp. GEM-RC1]